jgi:hypothetical protein
MGGVLDWRPMDGIDGWVFADDGVERYVAARVDEAWVLCDVRDGGYEVLWASDDLDECFEIGAAAFRHSVFEDDFWWDRRTPIERPSAAVPGVTLVVSDAGAGAFDGEGNGLCRFDVALSGWRATWVLGEPTVNCASHIEEAYRHRGLGREIYDLIEEYYRLPLAPQGRNAVHGSLSADAAAFWEKRAARRRVPGWGDAAAGRAVGAGRAGGLAGPDARPGGGRITVAPPRPGAAVRGRRCGCGRGMGRGRAASWRSTRHRRATTCPSSGLGSPKSRWSPTCSPGSPGRRGASGRGRCSSTRPI